MYETDSLSGSSGAPVIALDTCEIVALHQTGVPKMDDNKRPLTKSGAVATLDTPDDEIEWVANAGIRISRILELLQKKILMIRHTTLRKMKFLQEPIN